MRKPLPWTRRSLVALLVVGLEAAAMAAEPWQAGQRMGPRGRLQQEVLVLPQPPLVFVPGTILTARVGNRASAADQQILPTARDQTLGFNWDASRVPTGRAVVWQVSRVAFQPFAGGTEGDTQPHGLVASAIVNGAQGGTDIDFGKLADELGLRPGRRVVTAPPPQPEPGRPGVRINPGGIDIRIDLGWRKDSPRREPERRERGRFQFSPADAFYEAGGSVIFYVRGIPLTGVESPAVAGMPSNVICVYYGNLAPPQPARLELPSDWQRKQPDLRVDRFDYFPFNRYCRAHRNPADCSRPIRGRQDQADPLDGDLNPLWDWDDESYAKVRKEIVDTALAGLPMVPREVLEAAVDSTWATAGIPPALPNTDRVIAGGIDELAQCAVEQAGIPAGLQARALNDFKRGLKRAQPLAADRILDRPRNAACQFVVDPPCVLVTLENPARSDARSLHVCLHDTGGVFDALPMTLDKLPAGGQIVVPFLLVRAERLEYYDGPAFDRRKWFNAYMNRQMQFEVEVSVAGPGGRQLGRIYASPARKWGNQFFSQ